MQPRKDLDTSTDRGEPLDEETLALVDAILAEDDGEPEGEAMKCSTCTRPAWTCRKCGTTCCGHKCGDKNVKAMEATCLSCQKGDYAGHPFRGNQYTDRASEDRADYGDAYSPPSPQMGAPLHDLTANGVYPGDVYGSNGPRYYGDSNPFDRETFDLVRSMAGDPEAEVTIYRAVPKKLTNPSINAGDWVAITRDYAEMHGDSRFDGKYRILEAKVKARELFTNGNSIHEWGYWPGEGDDSDSAEAARQERIAEGRQMRRYEAVGLVCLTKAEWDESEHPREPAGSTEGGQFTSDGGGGGAAPTAKEGFDTEGWRGRFTKDPKATIAAYEKLSPAEKRAASNPTATIPGRMKDHLGDTPWPERSGDIQRDVAARLDQFKGQIHPESQASATLMLTSLNGSLRALGVPAGQAERMMRDATDTLVAQEFEAQTRLLGDHGIAHLSGDARLATRLMSVLPGGAVGERDRAMMTVTAIYHDTGYLTPTMRVNLGGHKEESAAYFEKFIEPMYARAFGKAWAGEARRLIGDHDTTVINFADRRLTAFSLADNLALFQKEKLPPALRSLPGNIKVLVDLSEKKIGADEARRRFIDNVSGSTLPAKMKARFKESLYDLTPRTQEAVLGMLGSRLGEPEWEKDHLVLPLIRGSAHRALGKVLDLHQSAFRKLLKTYRVDEKNPSLMTNGFDFNDKAGRSKVSFRFATRKVADEIDAITKGDW